MAVRSIRLHWLFIILVPVSAAIGFSYFVPGPVHYYDEGGVLANALAVAGSNSEADNHYYFGYPILLAPSVLLAGEPAGLFRWVQTTNVGLYGLTCYLLFLVLRSAAREAALNPRTAVCLFGLLACCYPPLLSFTSMAWSENFVFLLVAASCYFLVELSRRRSQRAIVLLSACIGLTMWTHPRLIPMVPAILIALLFVGDRHAIKSNLFVLSSVALVMALAYHLLIHPGLEAMRSSHPGVPGERSYVAGNPLEVLLGLDLAGYRHIIARTLGGLLIFNINGFLLPGMVISSLLRRYFAREDRCPARNDGAFTPVVVFLSLSCIGTAVLVGFYFELYFADRVPGPGMAIATDPYTNRIDHWMYGRYTDAFLPVFLIIAFFYRSRKSLALSALATAVIAAITFACLPGPMFAPNYINILALWPYHLPFFNTVTELTDRLYLIALLSIAFCGNLLVAYALLRSGLFPAAALAIFLLTAVLGHDITRRHEAHTQVRYNFGSTMGANLAQGDCIYVDSGSITLPHGMYAFLLTPHELFDLNLGAEIVPCNGLLTMDPANFSNEFRTVTGPTDGFYGMVRRGYPRNQPQTDR